ncbi:MAG: hypothetical protein K0R76_1031 [Alphaproteobacteria bacterium]|nr:hypothetical protein [Alphaproteobacteria bacterium]
MATSPTRGEVKYTGCLCLSPCGRGRCDSRQRSEEQRVRGMMKKLKLCLTFSIYQYIWFMTKKYRISMRIVGSFARKVMGGWYTESSVLPFWYSHQGIQPYGLYATGVQSGFFCNSHTTIRRYATGVQNERFFSNPLISLE